MPTEIEFGSRAAANDVRDRYEEHLCSEDDRRLKTVRFSSDAPEGVLDLARAEADESRAVQERRSESVELTERERERIKEADGFTQQATTFSWQSAKGVFAREGLVEQFEDAIGALTDYDSPVEGAEDWIADARESDVQQGTRTAGGGGRDHGSEELQQQRATAAAARRAQGESCDHARDHCEHGDADACEFLHNACGLSEEEVEQLLAEPDADGEQGEQPIEGAAAGALKRAWGGYQGATADLALAVQNLEEQWRNAQQAARAINEFREAHGQEPLHFERLEGAQAKLEDLAMQMARDCYECHADHSEHDHTDEDGLQEARREFGELVDVRREVVVDAD